MKGRAKSHLSVVIELDRFDDAPGRTGAGQQIPRGVQAAHRMSAREAFFLNRHPEELMRRYPEHEWGSVLSEIERHQRDLDDQREPAQQAWATEGARRRYRSTGSAAEFIILSFERA
jgi:hypothetical protein